MSMIILSFALVALIFVWTFFWQKALTNYTKNVLFNYRDTLRSWFIAQGYGLEHPSYRTARNMINATLWHIEYASWAKYASFLFVARKFPEWDKEGRNSVELMFSTTDPKIAEHIFQLRKAMAIVFMTHIIMKSAIAIFFVLMFGAIKVVQLQGKKLLEGTWEKVASSERVAMPQSRLVLLVGFMITILLPVQFAPSRVEAWSLKSYQQKASMASC